MASSQSDSKYPKSMRWLHWLMALCIFGAILLGFYMNVLPKEWRGNGWWLHKSFGLTILILLPIRIWLRNRRKLPAPSGKNWLEKMLAHRTHQLLYLAMGLMASSGYVMLAARGKILVWFGIALPQILPINIPLAKFARHWHEPLAYLVLALIALHVVGALKHILIDKHNILKRML